MNDVYEILCLFWYAIILLTTSNFHGFIGKKPIDDAI